MFLVKLARLVSRSLQRRDFLGAETEQEKILRADLIADLDIGPVQRAMVSAPSIANFMFPVPDASLPAVEICSDRSAAG